MLKPIKTYGSVQDENGKYITELYILAIALNSIDEEGKFSRCSVGTDNSLDVPSITFIIDENIYEQLDDLRVKIINNKYELVPRAGYDFIEKELETPEQRRIRELEEQLAKLKAVQGGL
ncbi:hypothetical protein OGK36_000672 [Staphylococcus pseudintermedius]|nr:hypothetical protein [Staphylococcus pseudintermedius]